MNQDDFTIYNNQSFEDNSININHNNISNTNYNDNNDHNNSKHMIKSARLHLLQLRQHITQLFQLLSTDPTLITSFSAIQLGNNIPIPAILQQQSQHKYTTNPILDHSTSKSHNTTNTTTSTTTNNNNNNNNNNTNPPTTILNQINTLFTTILQSHYYFSNTYLPLIDAFIIEQYQPVQQFTTIMKEQHYTMTNKLFAFQLLQDQLMEELQTYPYTSPMNVKDDYGVGLCNLNSSSNNTNDTMNNNTNGNDNIDPEIIEKIKAISTSDAHNAQSIDVYDHIRLYNEMVKKNDHKIDKKQPSQDTSNINNSNNNNTNDTMNDNTNNDNNNDQNLNKKKLLPQYMNPTVPLKTILYMSRQLQFYRATPNIPAAFRRANKSYPQQILYLGLLIKPINELCHELQALQ